jgi:hypothetical protein
VIQIQATFTGYGGRPCSLFSAYDPDARVLVVGAEADYRTERRAGCIVLTNDQDIPRDELFTDADLMRAISAFYSLKAGIAAQQKAVDWILANYESAPAAVHAGSVPFLKQTGIVVGGWLMAKSAAIAAKHLAEGSTDDIAQRMANIKMATAEQGSATHDMARSAERVNAKTQQTDGNLQQVLGTLHGLAQCGESLKALVSRFKL